MIKLKPLLSGFLFIVSSTNVLSSISRNWDLLDNLNLGAFLWLELAQLLTCKKQLSISWSPTCVNRIYNKPTGEQRNSSGRQDMGY